MDPISIATAAGTASKTLYSISTTLYTFISSAKRVDKSLEALHNEVKAMARSLDSVQSVLKQPLLLRTKAEIPGADLVWTSTASAVGDTQRTARILQELVKGLGTMDASPNVFGKAHMQLKINFNSKDIQEIRTLCQSHFNSLNVSLHLVTMLIHCQSHDDSKIVSELNDLKKLVKDGQLDSNPGWFDALKAKLPEELKHTDMASHTQHLKRAAESVIDIASSVIDSQSVLGTRFSEANPDPFAYSSELMPEDSASNVGPGKNARKADDGIKEWLTGLKIDGTKSEITLKNGATSGRDALQQGSNCSDSSVGRLPSSHSSPDAAKPGNGSAEQASLDRALIALSRTKIVQNQSSMIAFLQDIVSNGVNLNAQDEEGLTALHWSSREGHLAFVKFLCERGANVNLKSNKGRIALQEAIERGHTAVVKLLLKHEATDLEQKDGLAQTPLLWAAEHGDPTILDALVKSNADLSAKGEKDDTALHLAAYYDHFDCVELLLQNKAPIASKNEDGHAPLHTAASVGSNRCVKCLINAGAPLEAKDSNGYTALSMAAFAGHSRVVELLLQAGAKTDYRDERFHRGSPLVLAAAHGHNKCVKLLSDAGALLEAVNRKGNTALGTATFYGNSEAVKLLLKAGARPDFKSSLDGFGPLQYSAQEGHSDCTRLLLDAGASIERTTPHGLTALMIASKRGHDKVVELLLGAGVKVDAQVAGWTSLKYATYYGHREVIDLLLAAEAKMEARGTDGQTILFKVMSKHSDDCKQKSCSLCSGRETREGIIKFLCKKGADVSAVDDDGYSLLKTLRTHGDHINEDEKNAIKKILRRFGAK